MKKNLFSLACLALCALLSLSACAEAAAPSAVTSKTGTAAESTAASESAVEAGPNWVSPEKTALKFWTMKEDTIEDLETNAYIKWLEEECNVDIQFEQASSAEALQKWNLSLASGTYPDVYMGCNQIQSMNASIMSSTLMKYGGAGIFLPLNNLIDQYGTNIKKLFADIDYVQNALTMPDGNIYALPTHSEIYHCRYSNKLWMDQSWLKNLNLKTPTTTDEFYNVLKAFKEQDANGNGDPNDEIPFAGCTDAWHSDPSAFLMNSFIYDDDNKRLAIVDDKIISIYDKDEYREGLTYINKLYSEGLLYSETFAQTSDQLKSLTSYSPNVVGSTTIAAPMGIMDGAADLYKDAATIAPLKGPKGVQYASYYGYDDLRKGAYIITSACKNPEAAFKLADFMYSQDASVRLRQGEFDVDWRIAKDGEKTFDGKPAEFARITPLITEGGAQNQHMGNTGVFRESNDSFIGAWAVQDGFDIRTMDGIEQLLIEQTWPYDGFEPEKTVPPIIFTDAENEEVAVTETEVQKYANEQRVLFITGQKSLETDWDAYVAELKRLDLDGMVTLYNTAYARMTK